MLRFRLSFKRTFRTAFTTILLSTSLVTSGAVSSISSSEAGLSVRVDSKTGAYEIASKKLAWSFGGSLNTPLKNVTVGRGHNSGGDYRQIAFEWRAGETPMSGWIRLYQEKGLAV